MPSREVSAEAEVERLTRALTTQTVRADGAEAEAVRLTADRDAALAQLEELTRALSALRAEVSAALGLPPTIGPVPGELARVLRATEAQRDEALRGAIPRGYVAITLAECDAAREAREKMAAELAAARAIIEGRTTPPTEAEIVAHDRAGGWWSYLPPPGQSSCTCAACTAHQQPGGELPRGNVRVVAGLGGGRWWALDSQRRPCAWPTTEAPDAEA